MSSHAPQTCEPRPSGGWEQTAPPLPNAGRLAVDYQLQQHELQVHQIKLSLQMEELQRSNVELQRMRDVYRDLYDLTPVGYFTLSQDGRVLEVNRAGCQLLGLEREALLRQRFSAYLDEASSVPRDSSSPRRIVDLFCHQ